MIVSVKVRGSSVGEVGGTTMGGGGGGTGGEKSERKEKQSSVGGEDWRKYEMGRKGEVCVGVMVCRCDGE